MVDLLDGDRHDHVARRGLARQRVASLSQLEGEPFLFIVNFQIPGDPPVSIVSYFALPRLNHDDAPSPAVVKFYKMFDRFKDLPENETDRLAAWGISRPPANMSKSSSRSSLSSNDQTAEEGLGSDDKESLSTLPPSSSSWFPSDVSWPSPYEPGALPPTDFRNARFKLIPQITEGEAKNIIIIIFIHSYFV